MAWPFDDSDNVSDFSKNEEDYLSEFDSDQDDDFFEDICWPGLDINDDFGKNADVDSHVPN